MKLLTGLLLGFLLLAPLPAVAAAAGKTVQAGDATITLPPMVGFQELYGKSPDFDKIVEHFVPDGNKLLAVYLSDADVAAMNADPQSGIKRYILVQTNVKGLTVATPADFKAIKEDFASQIGSGDWQNDKGVNDALDKTSGYLRNQLGQQAELKIGETRFLGKIVDTPDALSVMMLTNYGVATAKGQQSYPVVAGLSTLQLKSKVFIVFVYSNYAGDADIDFVSQNTRKFVELAVGLNNPASGDAEASDDTDSDKTAAPNGDVMSGAMLWATKGAALIALLAIVALLAPKLAKHFGRKDEIR